MLLFVPVINLVLRRLSGGAAVVLLSSCGIVTKPVKVVTGLVVKPAKIVTDAGVDILRKPVKEAAKVVTPSVWPGRIQR